MADGNSVPTPTILRRSVLLGLPLLLAGCEGGRVRDITPADFGIPTFDPAIRGRYGRIRDNGVEVAALELGRIEPRWLRQEVGWNGREAPGSIVVDPGARHLYLIQPGGRALRYGVGVGREGFGWSGAARVGAKSVWPTWTPPREMQLRDKEARKYAGGMRGGIDNPLGARALYLYEGGRDTLYRIHGTTEPYTIGGKVSSGCIRMFNHDVIDLYGRVAVGAPVTVLPTNLL